MSQAKNLLHLLRPDPGVVAARVEHLKKVSLFKDLEHNLEALTAFATLMEERIFKKTARIIVEGQASAEMFILLSGHATVFKETPEGDSFKVALLDGINHAYFGEGSLIGSETRSATIIAEEECHCLILSKDAFETLGKNSPQWVLPFFKAISTVTLSRLRKTNNDMLTLYRALVEEIRGQ